MSFDKTIWSCPRNCDHQLYTKLRQGVWGSGRYGGVGVKECGGSRGYGSRKCVGMRGVRCLGDVRGLVKSKFYHF